eukprot:2015687-Prorocentrum_lima.AAC.1
MPDVKVEPSATSNNTGKLGDGSYAEIHKVDYQEIVSAIKKEGTVTNHQGVRVDAPIEVYQDGLLGH